MPDEKTMDDAPRNFNADSASGWAAGYNAALGSMSQAMSDVMDERRRQTFVEGWTTDHDDTHTRGEMALAAGCYALHAASPFDDGVVPIFWPWDRLWWKPKSSRRDLVRAAALIVAEIERLDRAVQPKPE